MQVTGTIKSIGQTQKISEKFQKRELVVITNEQYPQTILIEFQGDKTEILGKYSVNQNVTVDINLRGREWVNPQGESKFFNTLVGWRISEAENTDNQNQQNIQEQGDGLPF